MPYARHVKLVEILDLASIPWQRGLPGLAEEQGAVWTVATPVRDGDVTFAKCRFGRSISEECNDKGKRQSLTVMVTALRHAIREQDYQAALKDTAGIGVKEAFSFMHSSKKERVWELKYQNKDRMYFFTHTQFGKSPSHLWVPLLFHHKKDPNTPDWVKVYCTEAVKSFLDPRAQAVTVFKENT